MQRRFTQRPSSRAPSLPYTNSLHNQPYNSKKKGRKITPIQLIIYCAIALVSLAMLLTPTQKEELVQAEHRVEEWVHKATTNQDYGPKSEIIEEEHELPEEVEKEEDEEDYVMHPELHPEKEKEWEEAYVHPHQKIEEKQQISQQAQKKDPPPSRWVDGEKELKKKLKVLYDQQNKEGNNLAAPVLTRYLGEDIPAFVRNSDSAKVEEWKKLVEEKYAEMRAEEEAWQKKMAEFIRQKDRDIGITTP